MRLNRKQKLNNNDIVTMNELIQRKELKLFHDPNQNAVVPV